MLLRILVFLLALILGILTMRYAKTLVDWGMRSAWADDHLPLGSYSAWKLVGLGLIVLGVVYLFGII